MGQLSKQQQFIAAVCIGLALAIFLFFNYGIKPARARIKERQVRLDELNQKIETANRLSRKLPQLQAENALLTAQLEKMEKQLPTDKDIPGILRLVTQEANGENLNFISLKPNDPRREQQYFDVLDFDVQMSGSLQALVRFMSKLGQQDRIFQFEKLALLNSQTSADAASSTPILTIGFVLKTYAYAGQN